MTLENQIQQLALVDSQQGMINPKMLNPSLFSEDKAQNEFGMPSVGSFLRVSDGNLAVITLGVILSSSVAGLVERWLPSVAQYAAILAGVALIYFGKNKKMIRDFGAGVLIGGLATMFSGLGSSLGGMFGEPKQNLMAEDKMTYGGGDGVYPTQPDRRVFQ